MLLRALSLAFLLSTAAPSQDRLYLICLRPDPARTSLAPGEADRIQTAHMANIHAMADRGTLVAAGPFGDTPTTISGIFFFKAPSLDEARRIAVQDPTVAEHRNTVDVHSWSAPKGIGEEYVRLHKADPKTPEGMGIQPLTMLYRGSAWDPQSPVLAAQSEYLARLRGEGKLAAAGAIENDADGMQHLVIFKRIPPEEAQRLMEESPAVKAGVLRAEHHRWWCADHVLPW